MTLFVLTLGGVAWVLWHADRLGDGWLSLSLAVLSPHFAWSVGWAPARRQSRVLLEQTIAHR